MFLDAITLSCAAEMWHDIKDVFQELIGRTAFFVTEQGVSGPQEMLGSDRLTFKATAKMQLGELYLLDLGRPIMVTSFTDTSVCYGYNGRATQYEGSICDISMDQLKSEMPIFRQILKSSSNSSILSFKYEERIVDSLERNSDGTDKRDTSEERDGITVAPYWIATMQATSEAINLVILRSTIELLYKFVYKSPLYESLMEADKRSMRPETEERSQAIQLINLDVTLKSSVIVIPVCNSTNETVTIKIGSITGKTYSDKKNRTHVVEKHCLVIDSLVIGTTESYSGRTHGNDPKIDPIMNKLHVNFDLTRAVTLAIRDVKRTGEKLTEKELRKFLKVHNDNYDPEDISSGSIFADITIPEIALSLKQAQYRMLVSAWQNNISIVQFDDLQMQKLLADMPEKQRLDELVSFEKKKNTDYHLEHGSTWFLQYVSKGATMARNWATSGWIFKSPEELYNKSNFDTRKIDDIKDPPIMMVRIDRQDRITEEVMKIHANVSMPIARFKLEELIDFHITNVSIDFDQSAKAVRPDDNQEIPYNVTHIYNRIVSETHATARIGEIALHDIRPQSKSSLREIVSLSKDQQMLQLNLNITQNDASAKVQVGDLDIVLDPDLTQEISEFIRTIDKPEQMQRSTLPKDGNIIIDSNTSLYEDLTLSSSRCLVISGVNKEIEIDGMGHAIELKDRSIMIQDGIKVKLTNAMLQFHGELNNYIICDEGSSLDTCSSVMKQVDNEVKVKERQLQQMLILQFRGPTTSCIW
jgi:hypothetical protein